MAVSRRCANGAFFREQEHLFQGTIWQGGLLTVLKLSKYPISSGFIFWVELN